MRDGVQAVLGARAIFVTIALLSSFPTRGLAQPATVPGATFIGTEKCLECHEDEGEKFGETKMGHIFLEAPRDDLEKLACENCHGPGSRHAADDKAPGLILGFGKTSTFPVEVQNQACLQCHEQGPQTFWRTSAHEAKSVACVDCHEVMKKTTNSAQLAAVDEKNPFGAKRAQTETCLKCHAQRAAQMQRSSHMPLREGKMTCADCHNPHGSLGPSMLKQASITENCYSCHAEKRGPFLWEHPPVRENCMNCHDAHGSMHASLLKVKPPRLCQQCHIETRHPTSPQTPNNQFVLNRSCANCHPQVHGSNHPSGVRFMR
jgi:DmsE family decaheme c-type cytochrome